MYEEAIAAQEKARELNPSRFIMTALAYTYGVSGREDEARKILRELEEQTQSGPALFFSIIYIGLGEKELALEWLEKGYDQDAGVSLFAQFDPIFDPLRDDPRFQDLLRRLNVPE
jgi:serine/threonine-protein kinase